MVVEMSSCAAVGQQLSKDKMSEVILLEQRRVLPLALERLRLTLSVVLS